MKTFLKFTALSVVLLMLVAGFVSCNEVESPSSPETLKGTSWRLIGIVDAETGDLRMVRDFDCYRAPESEHYKLVFDLSDAAMQIQGFIAADCYEDGLPAFFTRTPGNFLAGCYKFDINTQSIQVSRFGGTRLGELDELPRLYYNAFVYAMMSPTPQIFLKENTLRLYFNDKKYYLLFKQIQP